MKEFNLEEAKAGKPVCTRDGRKARIICFDRHFCNDLAIIALVENNMDFEETFNYTVSGRYNGNITESNSDLMMVGEKKEGWINLYWSKKGVYPGKNIYDTKESAMEAGNQGGIELASTSKIEWEE